MSISVNNGSYQTAKEVFVRDAGVWRACREVYINVSGTWQLVYGVSGGGGTISPSVGTSSFTVPEGIYSISVSGCGGGGAGGSGDGGANNDGPGYGGGGANIITASYSVSPGDVLSILVGAGGTGAFGARGIAGSPTMISGAGFCFFAAGGGGGASWNGWGPGDQLSPAYLNPCTGLSVAAVEGGVYRGGLGANGANGGGRPTAGTTTNGGANGGTGGNYNMQGGTSGGVGKLSITY
tara:strand:- start:2950 stop:3660 length:711 start_codon:yes stop_codon:yes gene_type:complete